MRVLRSIQSSNDIDNAVKTLNDDAIDVLMKYIYKGFEKEPKDSSILLTWHEKVSPVSAFLDLFNWDKSIKSPSLI